MKSDELNQVNYNDAMETENSFHTESFCGQYEEVYCSPTYLITSIWRKYVLVFLSARNQNFNMY